MQFKIHKNNNIHILYNPALVTSPPDSVFCEQDSGTLVRGTARFFEHGGLPMVLKRYYRGGLVGRFIRQTYPATSEERSRMWTEFRLLARLRSMGLPVPEPVAARCKQTSPLTCQGELITRRISNARTLTEAISDDLLPRETWEAIGATISRFHDNDVYHADLNASNILIDDSAHIYLIDFDKGRIRSGSPEGWKMDNIRRLKRSLEKQKELKPDLHFAEENWQSLLAGYG